MTFTRSQIELALSEGHLFAQMANGRWWRLRRNGRTRLWKTRPSEWAIPVKAGMRSYTTLTHRDQIGIGQDARFDFCIQATAPVAEHETA